MVWLGILSGHCSGMLVCSDAMWVVCCGIVGGCECRFVSSMQVIGMVWQPQSE